LTVFKLLKGWNTIIIKTIHTEGTWAFTPH